MMAFYTDLYSDEFTFLSPEEEPKIPPKERERALKTIQHVTTILSEKITEEKETKCCQLLCSCCGKQDLQTKTESSTEITPEMQTASNQGLNMVKSMIFPVLPSILQDVWVYFELIVSIVAFALGGLDTFASNDGIAFRYSYFILATIAMIMGLIDAFVYFIQLGSCARLVRHIHKKSRERNLQDEQQEPIIKTEENVIDNSKCCRLSDKSKECLTTWFELCRNVLSELIIYPLLIFDLFQFITEKGYHPKDDIGRTNFGLFVICGFYLILAVYIMRVFMVAGSMVSLLRIPTYGNVTEKTKNTSFIILFCIHILGQIAAHFMIILVIAAKIKNENPFRGRESTTTFNTTNQTSGSSGFNVHASPFLITTIILGEIIPLLGVSSFFVVNYFWMKEFSIGFWLKMISLLQGESFAEAVFGGEGIAMAKSKALDFVEKSQYMKVKKQLKQFQASSFITKFFFPVRVPLTAIIGLVYDIALLVLVICLMLTYEEDTVKLAVFQEDNVITSVFILAVTVIILANIHVLILLNIVLVMVLVIFATSLAIALFLLPVLLLIYCPIVASLGVTMLCYDTQQLIRSIRKKYKSRQGREQGIELTMVTFN